jgi:hypothetical protein
MAPRQPVTANKRQMPGTPLSSCSPRSSNSMVLALTVALATSAVAAQRGDGPSGQTGYSVGVTDEPVTFSVVNLNRSQLACSTDAKRYTVHGHLVGPAGPPDRLPSGVTLYLHGATGGEWMFHEPREPPSILQPNWRDGAMCPW